MRNLFFTVLLCVSGGMMHLGALLPPVEVDVESCACRIEGKPYPVIGFGTYPLQGDVCAQAIRQAAELGYRIFDTATFYENFEAIAKGLKGGNRADFYLISKVWHDKQTPHEMRKDLESTLKQLHTQYLDAY